MQHLILQALELSIEQLKNDLSVLQAQMLAEKSGMFITHDNSDILVYASKTFKAYVPKKYNGFDVVFHEWKDDSMSLDLVINLDPNEQHRIFVS